MAIHDLKCVRCGTEFEFMKIRSDDVAECPKCEATGEENFEKKPPTGIGLDFRGPNWAGKGKQGY